jgi:predicted RNA polymerase sigma factor
MANLDSVFRREWGPAVATLARWSGDLTVAEDAVQEAFAEALRAWPRDGVPDNAERNSLLWSTTYGLARRMRACRIPSATTSCG